MRNWLFLAAIVAAFTAAAEKPRQAAIASAHPLATAAGLEALAAGGNAFDAAVAVAATLAVVEPASSGIGGGAYFLIHDAASGEDWFIDAREVAPQSARAEHYLDEAGKLNGKSIAGPLAAGIPGQPAGLVFLAEQYGKLELSQTLAAAIAHARNGMAVDDKYRTLLTYRAKSLLVDFPATAAILMPKGTVPEVGELIVQPDLAATLEAVANDGHDGFYRGTVAEKLIAGVNQAGGAWTAADLSEYQVKRRAPLTFSYASAQIVTSPPSSSGGVALATAFGILDFVGHQRLAGVDRVHLEIEALRRAYRDRAEFLGDTDHVTVPLQRLLDRDYHAGLAQTIRLDSATPSASLPGFPKAEGGTDTTHFSIVDRDGNLVAATLSINLPYGSLFIPDGTGVLLNNEMDDFAFAEGQANAYGLIGQHANSVAPGKRMLSSMTPTFLRTDERIAVVGTPGGSRIITMVFGALLALMDGASAAEAVKKPRIHHQFYPDVLSIEPGALDSATVTELRQRGHSVSDGERTWGNMHIVAYDRRSGAAEAASDPRWASGSARLAD